MAWLAIAVATRGTHSSHELSWAVEAIACPHRLLDVEAEDCDILALKGHNSVKYTRFLSKVTLDQPDFSPDVEPFCHKDVMDSTPCVLVCPRGNLCLLETPF